VRGFLQPRLILLLLDKPAHGYELMERLSAEPDMPEADPGLLYRVLRQLEGEGFLQSSWDTEGQGPARRLYEVTPEGVEFLHTWAARVRVIRRRLDQFLTQYEARFGEGEATDEG
jgi:poly-beta-hydroxybutyrate-responsive repressor